MTSPAKKDGGPALWTSSHTHWALSFTDGDHVGALVGVFYFTHDLPRWSDSRTALFSSRERARVAAKWLSDNHRTKAVPVCVRMKLERA